MYGFPQSYVVLLFTPLPTLSTNGTVKEACRISYLHTVLSFSGISESGFKIGQVWSLVHKASQEFPDFDQPCSTTTSG